MKISAVVLTKNEQKDIKDCIKNLGWSDEIIVVDDNSSDNTAEIARKEEAKVIINSLDNDFSKQRNFALSKARNDWVLFVDADERVSTALVAEISSLSFETLNKFNGFYIRRIDTMWAKKLKNGEAGKVRLLRLGKKDLGIWSGKVHERWLIKGEIGNLKNPIRHSPHPDLTEFLEEINKYTDIRAKELYDKKIKANFFSILFYPFGKFIDNYFLKQGIRDNVPGLIHALIMSFHSFLVRGKLWMLWNKKTSNV